MFVVTQCLAQTLHPAAGVYHRHWRIRTDQCPKHPPSCAGLRSYANNPISHAKIGQDIWPKDRIFSSAAYEEIGVMLTKPDNSVWRYGFVNK